MRYLSLAVCVLALPAAAQEMAFQTGIDTRGLRAVPVEQPPPRFPGGGIRTGQEGWVQLNVVVAPDGTVRDPVIVDSIGGAPFEAAALEVLEDWRFEAPSGGEEINNNLLEMRFELQRGRDAATSNFLRRYRRIMTHVHGEQTEQARTQLDETVELGGWNLYESAMLCLMTGRVEDQEGNALGKLEYYRRAIAVDDRGILKARDRRDVLLRLFEVEYETGQYAAALDTAARLAALPGSDDAPDTIADDVEAIRERLAGPGDVVAEARIVNACACDTGQPLWRYRPARKRFAFSNVGTGVERFEARCDAWRMKSAVEAGVVYELPAEAANCRVFVFGEDGADFRFIEAGDGSDG